MDKVVHFEIPADDVSRAKEFYAKIFGWKLEDVPGMDYTLVYTVASDPQTGPKEKGAINGGMAKRTDYFPAPSVSIDVKDIDATLKQVESHGGEVVRPKTPVGDMGFTAIFKDSEGNYTGLWQNA